jgi:hypothetical protein
MTSRDLYAVNEARERLGGISRNSLYALLRRGALTSVVTGCHRFIPVTAIERFIATTASTVRPSVSAARVPRSARPPSGRSES